MKTESHPDALPVRLVILFVGLVAVLSLFMACWLYWLGKSGEGVLAITNGCVMGLLALLGRTESRGRQNDAPVEVTTPPNKPLETTDVSPEGEGEAS